MSPAHDLMERLAAADLMPDVAPLRPEQQREADALLERLLATPAERHRPHRRWPQLAAATAIAAAAVFAGLSVLDSDEGPVPHVVAKAVAALTDNDAVYHVQAIAHLRASDMPEEGKRVPFFESWHTTGGLMHRVTYAEKDGGKGRLYDDFAGRRRPGRRGGPALRYDARSNTITESGFGRVGGGGAPGLDPFDPSRGLKELQAEGRLRSDGRVEVDGKPAYRLVSGPVPGFEPHSVERVEFLVDAETYLPRAQHYFVRYKDGTTVRVVWRYLIYERLPLNDRTRSLLALDPHPGAKCSPFAGKMTGRRSVGFPNPCAR
jgi:hypothetical protein